MLRHALFVLLILLHAVPAEGQRFVRCKDEATGSTDKVELDPLRRALARLPRLYRRREVHLADLNAELLSHRKLLPGAMRKSDWCRARAHAIPLEDTVLSTVVDLDFAAEKFGRVERWARGTVGAAGGRQLQRHLVVAARKLAAGKAAEANRSLNEALAVMLGREDIWAYSARLEELLDPAKNRREANISKYELKAACPKLVAKKRATRAETERLLNKVAKLMDEGKLRTLDIKGGDALAANVRSYSALGAHWPAARALCGMLSRFKLLTVDLGMVQARFQLVATWRNDHTPPAGAEERFAQLVRDASDHIAERAYDEALPLLDQLLVLMGQPAKPSDSLRGP